MSLDGVDRDEVQRHVRTALKQELAGRGERADSPPATVARSRPTGDGIVTDAEVERRIRQRQDLSFPRGTRFTPLARETLDRHLRNRTLKPPHDDAGRGPRDCIAVGADHGGFPLKEEVARHLRDRGFAVLDCGTESPDACDYPIFARRVALAVKEERATAGIVVDGAGIGSAMTVNKVPGVRAAHCHTQVEARNAREHNHAHVLTLGAGIVGRNLALAVVDAFLATPFGGDRHARRVALIENPGAEEKVSR